MIDSVHAFHFRKVVDAAIYDARLEGLEITDEGRALLLQFTKGEITQEAYKEEVLRRAGVDPSVLRELNAKKR